MSGDTDTIKLPLWAIAMITGIIGAVLTGVGYMVETHSLAVENAKQVEKLEQDQKERFDRIENGIGQLWERHLDQLDINKKAERRR